MPRLRSIPSLAVSLGLALAGCATSGGPTGEPKRDSVSAEDRARVKTQAETVEKDLHKRGLEYSDPALAEYLESLRAPLAAQDRSEARDTYRIIVLRTPVVNAFALPDGVIYIHAGALATVDDETQLALLIAHEMNHTALEHLAQEVSDRRSKTIAAKLTGVALGPLAIFSNLGFSAAIAGYSRDKEEEADREGLRWVAQAGFATATAPQLFTRFNEVEEPGALGVLWSDHPLNDERRTYTEALLASGRIPANPNGRNDAARLRSAVEGVSRESLRLRLANEQYELAQKDAQRMIERYGESAPLRYALGESALRLAHPAKELPRELQARGMSRRDREAADARELERQQKQSSSVDTQLAGAEREFRRALELDPAHGPSRRGLGEVLWREGDSAGAEATLTEYLAANPSAPDARLIQGLLKEIRASSPGASKE